MSRITVGSGAPNSSVAPPPNSYPPAQYQTQRRPLISGRQPDELHIPSGSAAMGDYNRYQAPPAYGGNDGLSINVQPSTPQHLSGNAGNTLPGALQPGPMARPGPLSSNTAPMSIPTLPHISTQMQQPPVSARPAGPNHSHSYSRSSPTTLEQVKYKAFTNTPEAAKYGSSNAMNIPQTPQTSSYSPLGLADIRPRTDGGFSDDPTSPGFYQSAVDHQQYPKNSQYLAPWPIYASDWCKWPPRPHGGHAGKVAIGSYLEDNHNFVRLALNGRTCARADFCMFRSKYSMLREHSLATTTPMEKSDLNLLRQQRRLIHIPSHAYYGNRLHLPSRAQIYWRLRATIFGYGLFRMKHNHSSQTPSIDPPFPKSSQSKSCPRSRCYPIRNLPNIPPQSPP